jgi:hypothetical protein
MVIIILGKGIKNISNCIPKKIKMRFGDLFYEKIKHPNSILESLSQDL